MKSLYSLLHLRSLLWFFLSLALLTPLSASAHAIPVTMSPEASSATDEAPAEIQITFSERIDPGASAIAITSPTMVMKVKARLAEDDPRTLVAPLMNDGHGTYLVSWSVVSADDGHFTKGSYAFAVGKGMTIATSTEETEVITIATKPEALSMTVELFGNGLMWAALVLFALVIRPLKKSGQFKNEEPLLHKGFTIFLGTGALLAIIGGALQLYIKSLDLSSIQFTPLVDALFAYLQTASGSATVVRIVCALSIGILLVFAHKRILRAPRFTFFEALALLALVVFAFYRAKISHATANPFHPELSIAINFLHVIEKDIWAGIACALAIAVSIRSLRHALMESLPRIFSILAVDFALVSVTASYIVWLHLKSFGNLFTTQWGTAFLQLFGIAVVLVALRLYHSVARVYQPRLFSRLLPISIGAEFAVALMVVYYSSVVIITSPPLSDGGHPVLQKSDQGVTVTLERDRFDDSALLLTTTHPAGTPAVTFKKAESADSPVSIELRKKFEGGYTIPLDLFSSETPYEISVTAPQSQGYDAHVSLTTSAELFASTNPHEDTRTFDTFTLMLLVIAASTVGLSILLYRLALMPLREHLGLRGEFLAVQTALACIAVALVAGSALQAFSTSKLANPFKWACEDDGNMWHLMQPMRSGVPLSQTATEGCMWGMGRYSYMIADHREYAYLSTLPHAKVSIDKTSFAARVPSRFTITLTEEDGTPAKLFTDMEKLLHVVIVSRDQSVFAHIHPDDVRPLTQKQIDTSTFTLEYTFPKSGTYLMVADYAHGLTLESEEFEITVSGSPAQDKQMRTYPSLGEFGGYQVSLDSGQPYAGEVETLRFTFSKDGKPVDTILPYLSAAMHVSVVKEDFSEFIHVHGEVHPPGTQAPPVWVKNGKVVHSMAAMTLPEKIGPDIEAHLVFPSRGIYTIWAQVKIGDKVIPSAFTVKVE